MLNQLPFQSVRRTYQISGENPTGGKGCANIPVEGQEPIYKDKKVHPFTTVAAGQTIVLAQITGSGSINEFFFTVGHPFYSELVLRCYWDDEEVPSVECPIGAFFANGFDAHQHAVNSLPVAVINRNAYNCYWTMPFRKSARITLTNEGPKDTSIIAWRFLYQLYDLPEDTMYFHAQYRRSVTSKENPVHTILDGVKGKGNYVGTYLAWNATNSDWWGEGEVKFYIDGDDRYPTLADNGTEDYFGGSFGFSEFNTDDCMNDEHTFSTPFLGMPLALLDSRHNCRKYSLYRWHIYDSIGFFEDLRVTVDTISLRPGRAGLHAISDDVASVAYWYQSEPHTPFGSIVPVEDRYDR